MTVILIAVVLYLLAAGLLVRSVAGDAGEPSRPWLWPALGAVALHAAYHLLVAWRTPGGRTCTSSRRFRWYRWAWRQ
ncbi:hypothetical protein MUU73_03060 [Pseudoxanthomonas mexicana]|nr:hypothetical protein MUU73_03060 [Pseudoxanthomonas mexicana]